MPANILDGNRIAADIRDEVASRIHKIAEAGKLPGLAVVQVGNVAASDIYVRNKVRTCREIGMHSEHHALPETVSESALLAAIDNLNRRDEVDGILVQLPLPKHIDASRVLLAIDPRKDVDGFHPINVGNLSTRRPGLVPCTPAGVMEILRRSHIAIEGADAVVIGRSDIVGKPVAMLLTNANATVTIAHSRTHDLAGVCRRADILVAAVGQPALVTKDFVKPGATVIDVGINRITDRATFDRYFKGNEKREAAFAKNGSTIVGDVDPRVAEIAGAITPVPGGVGPLTIAMLLSNTLKAFEMRRGAALHATAEQR